MDTNQIITDTDSVNNAGIVTTFDDRLFKGPSEKAYTVKTMIMVEMDIISNEDSLGDSVKSALSNLSLGDDAKVVSTRFDIIPLDLGEHVN